MCDLPRTTCPIASSILLLFLAGWCAAPAARAELVISPAAIRVSLDGERPNGVFTLTNVGDTAQRYRARAVHFRLSENGALVFTAPDEHSLATWIRFNPSEFEIPPQGKRVVRYSILVPGGAKQGEYWGGIEFEPLESVLTRHDDGKGHTLNIRVLTSALVTIFGDKGNPVRSLAPEGASLSREGEDVVLRLRLRNTGEGKVDLQGAYELRGGAGDVLAEGALPAQVLLRGGERELSFPLGRPLEAGSYTLKLTLGAVQLEKATYSELTLALGQ